MTKSVSKKISALKKRWEQLKAENPNLRIRDAATHLGVSEAELLTTNIGENCVRLIDKFDELLQELHSLGRIMALTRNDAIVHERKGYYNNVEILKGHGKMGLVVGEDIDLRIFFNRWHFGFAVTNVNQRGVIRSFQFFDIDGTAVHKIYLTETSNLNAYEKLVEKYHSENQNQSLKVSGKPVKPFENSDAEIDAKGFRDSWAAMKDTHDFFSLTRKFGVSRQQALRLADREMAFQVSTETYRYVLEKASETKLPIMIFVGNPGIIQIHTGEVENIVEARGWLNVLDEKFNLHIKQEEIVAAWIVRKPTVDGIVSSLELFDSKNENVALFFGKRKPGNPESQKWRELLMTVS